MAASVCISELLCFFTNKFRVSPLESIEFKLSVFIM